MSLAKAVIAIIFAFAVMMVVFNYVQRNGRDVNCLDRAAGASVGTVSCP